MTAYRFLYCLAFVLAIFTTFAKAEDSIVLGFTYDFDAGEYHLPVIDSKYGYLPVFNTALSNTLDTCPNADPAIAAGIRLAPNRFSTLNTRAIEALSTCKPELKIANHSGVPLSLYRSLTGQTTAPSVLQRVKTLIFRGSPLSPDYDRTAWDLDTASIFTWGPFRASAGRECALQSLMQQLIADQSTKRMVQNAFEEQTDFIKQFSKAARCDAPKSRKKIKRLFNKIAQDSDRRRQLELSFAHLAESTDVRRIYDDFFFGPKGKLASGVVKYIKAWTDAGLKVSEIDFGFFLDRSLQYPALKPVELAKLKILFHKKQNLSNLAARKILSREFNFSSSGARGYLTGRDAQFFVDANSRPEMDANERAAWLEYSGILASDLGLSDKAYDYCSDLLLSKCAHAEPPHE